jgi:tRNA(adenine34) deaminase
MNNDRHYMRMALHQAQKALEAGEFPVGCVMVLGDEPIVNGSRQGTAGNNGNEIDHAEMVAIKRLTELNPPLDRHNISIYCTMEPCLMCFGALLINGISRIVYAYEDAMGGGTGCNLEQLPPLYRDQTVEIIPHIMRSESLDLFKAFFSDPEKGYWRDSLLARYTLAQ